MISAEHTNHDRHHHRNRNHSDSQLALLRWTAGLGAVTADALAAHLGVSVASARGHLRTAVAKGLVRRCSPLTDQPALYGVTRAGVRAAGVDGIDPCTVSAAGAPHLIECARVAASLERRYPGHRVQGERQLRAQERTCGRLLASAQLGAGAHTGAMGAARRRHRPDLVLWPPHPADGMPVAVEVELTVKAPERLTAICRAWARAGCVAGVLYLAPPEVERAVARAVERARAHHRVLVVPLHSLLDYQQ
jgi:DNA-binding CsgD family transcriptional regulator